MKAWEHFLTSLEEDLGKQIVNRWLRPLHIIRFDAGNIYLEAKDYFQALWFEEHIRPKAEKALTTNSQRKIKIHLTIENSGAPRAKHQQEKSSRQQKTDIAKPFDISFDEIDLSQNFENYLCSLSNTVPYRLLSGLCGYDSQKGKYGKLNIEELYCNPVYFYGPEGSGKTHLLMSAAQALQMHGLSVIFVRAKTFTEHVIKAIRAGEMSLFRQTYRNTDVLIMDDVHLLSRKGATQEELFHTFNALHLAGKQIILGANCSPQELQLIEPRLISRFEWGISLPIDPLAREEMRGLLNKKTEALQFPLIQKVKDFIIDTFAANPKTLLTTLDALMLRSHLQKGAKFSSTTLTLPQVKHTLTDLINEAEHNLITPEKIIHAVAEHYSIPQEEILGKSQSRDCVYPRQIVMFLCRTKLNMPFMKIGDFFSKDHSTVMTSVKRIQKSLETNELGLSDSLSEIDNKLRA